jgi:hypothetical protein
MEGLLRGFSAFSNTGQKRMGIGGFLGSSDLSIAKDCFGASTPVALDTPSANVRRMEKAVRDGDAH